MSLQTFLQAPEVKNCVCMLHHMYVPNDAWVAPHDYLTVYTRCYIIASIDAVALVSADYDDEDYIFKIQLTKDSPYEDQCAARVWSELMQYKIFWCVCSETDGLFVKLPVDTLNSALGETGVRAEYMV